MFITNETVIRLKWSNACKVLTLARSVDSVIIAAVAIIY